ncbi:hypothetical protein Tco_1175954, partial [Tanacetum coccineum]
EPKSHTQKPGRQIAIGQRFSPKKSSAVHEKPNTPRSCLRWKPTGRIFKIAGLRWIPTGKMFTDNTTKGDSEPPNGSNGDITNPYECDQTLNVSASLVPNPPPAAPYVPPTNKELEILIYYTKAFDGRWQSQALRNHMGTPAQTRSERVLEKPNEPPLSEGHTSRSGKGRMEHQFELTANVPLTPDDSSLPGGYIPGSDEDSYAGREKVPTDQELLEKMLNLQLEAEEESTMAFELIKFIKSMLEE